LKTQTNQDIPASTRRSLTRIALLISLLARHCIPLTLELISEAHDVAVRLVGEEREGLRRLAAAAAGEEEGGEDQAGVEVLKALAMGRAD
jgi:exosome complex component RRP4